MQIAKVLTVGDKVYDAENGKPLTVTRIYSCGISTESGYLSFDDHRERFWLTKKGYLDSTRSDTV